MRDAALHRSLAEALFVQMRSDLGLEIAAQRIMDGFGRVTRLLEENGEPAPTFNEFCDFIGFLARHQRARELLSLFAP